ncbi:MAG: hypothetical protein WCH04_19560 [Gammaproteobacteria bacterium]
MTRRMCWKTVAVAAGLRVSSPVVINRLTAYRYTPDRLCRLLFVVALVICQFGLVLHQMDIEHHANGKECTICLASQSLDHALGAGFVPPTVQASVEIPGALPASLAVSRTPVQLVARSPPVSPLHA